MKPLDCPPLKQTHSLLGALDVACQRIAPQWPLDQLIAVNPHWGWVSQPIDEAAAKLAVLQGGRIAMPRERALQAWRDGDLSEADLREACQRQAPGGAIAFQDLMAALQTTQSQPPRMLLISDCGDLAPLHPALTNTEAVRHQVSQHCAAYFDQGQASWTMDQAPSLYGQWRVMLGHDLGLSWASGRIALQNRLKQLPEQPLAAVQEGLTYLGLPASSWADYLSALLLNLQGWASWCAYLQWQARQRGSEDSHLLDLLAIRLSWEVLLQQDQPSPMRRQRWVAAWADTPASVTQVWRDQRADWLLQEAMELAYQRPLAQGLLQASAPSAPETTLTSSVQAVFCIDVRSEVFRRALEKAAPGLQTCGFAGFFGLPLAYRPLGTALERPQLPGLLAPTFTVEEEAESPALGQWLAQKRRQALGWRQVWQQWRGAASSSFSFVETLGMAYGAKLLTHSLPNAHATARWEDSGLPPNTRLQPTWAGQAPSAEVAAGILRAMGLAQGAAPLVLLAGHGAQSANNPTAAALACGACGGQAGDVNARVLARWLNEPDLRAELTAHDVHIPASTWFVAGLHNTTTDDFTLFDLEDLPPQHQAALRQLQDALAQAGDLARAERAPLLGADLTGLEAPALHQRLRQRAQDWSEPRPEWGLANNAAMLVAPRSRSRHLDLQGRCFLHDYDWRTDPQGQVLRQIMTAPVVVAHWINLQYNASTVDNALYGSGHKPLHNVVGGRIGVFEGNGGDLRLGLALQSLHDGTQWRHTPLRLSVFVEAPRVTLDSIIATETTVRQLVENGWLHLLRIDTAQGTVERRQPRGWAAL
jgi:uncharacterized protein YbcC (UPF0753/DUF2309 family)